MLARADLSRTGNAKAITVEQQGEFVEAELVGQAGAIAAEIGRAIAEDYVSLARSADA